MRGFSGRFRAILFGAALALVLLQGAEKKPKPKPAIVEMQGLKVTVDGSKINIDGNVHNSGERVIEKLVLSFHFLDSENKPVTTLKLELDDETIDPDDDAEVHAAANEPPRAVSMEVTAADRGEKDLKVINPGPYRIE